MLPSDFDVVEVGSTGNLAVFAAERKDCFHLVSLNASGTLRQFHIPHFTVATAIHRSAGSSEEQSIQPLCHGVSLLTQRCGPLGLVMNDLCFLLNGSKVKQLEARM